jgi:hypothetical protein
MHHNLTTASSFPRPKEPFRRGVLQGCLQQLSKNYWILQVLASNTNKNSDQAGQGKVPVGSSHPSAPVTPRPETKR